MIIGDWQTVTLDYDKTAEYSGQDIDTTSDLFDLTGGLSEKGFYDGFEIIIPTIETGTVSLLIAQTSTITEVPVPLHVSNGVGATVLWTVTSGTGGLQTAAHNVGAIQYGRIKTGGNQSANRSFKIRGFRS
jgi:hypothetical protein